MKRWRIGAALIALSWLGNGAAYIAQQRPELRAQARAPARRAQARAPARVAPKAQGQRRQRQRGRKAAGRSKMDTYTVSGAGSTDWNGDYPEAGTLFGYPYYQKDSTHYIAHDPAQGPPSGGWVMVNSVAGGPGWTPYYYSVTSTNPTPDVVWDTENLGSLPIPTVALAGGGDTTAPVVADASVDAAGTTLTIEWTEAGTVSGSSGLTLTGLTHGAATLSSVSTSGTTTTATISRAIDSDETPTLSYTPGDFADNSSNDVAGFSGQAITNDSTQTYTAPDTTAPVFASASLSSTGDSLAVTFTETGSAPLLPSSGVTGFTVKVNGDTATISGATASGTTVTLALAAAANKGDTVTVAYSGGNVTDSAATPNAATDFSAQAVTNGSIIPPAPHFAQVIGASMAVGTGGVWANEWESDGASKLLLVPSGINAGVGKVYAPIGGGAAQVTYRNGGRVPFLSIAAHWEIESADPSVAGPDATVVLQLALLDPSRSTGLMAAPGGTWPEAVSELRLQIDGADTVSELTPGESIDLTEHGGDKKGAGLQFKALFDAPGDGYSLSPIFIVPFDIGTGSGLVPA